MTHQLNAVSIRVAVHRINALAALSMALALAGCASKPVEQAVTLPPVAAIAPADVTVEMGGTASFDGATSYDPQARPLTYAWRLRSRPATSAASLSTATEARTTLVADVAGAYVVELVVTAAGGQSSAPAIATLTANMPAPTLVANAGPDQMSSVGLWVSLDGTKSHGQSNDVLTFKWSIASKPASSTTALLEDTSPTPRFLADVMGVYDVSLRVFAADNVATDTVRITVGPPNHPPRADAGLAIRAMPGALVTLDGSKSSDPDGDSLSFSWRPVSKPMGATVTLTNPSGARPSFTPTAVGFYSFELTVSDGRGLSATAFARVIVSTSSAQNDVFDPGEVYLLGTLSEGSCGADAIAHWATPNNAATGFDCYLDEDRAQVRPTDGRLVYTNTFEDLVREFHCDANGCPVGSGYVTNAQANDTIIATPCGSSATQEVSQFRLSAQGLLFHTCQSSGGKWRDLTGTVIHDEMNDAVVSFGFNGWVLTQTKVLNTGTHASLPITGLPSRSWVTSRAKDNGTFWVVVAAASMSTQPELWEIGTDGSAKKVGEYPAAPPDTRAGYNNRLDATGALFSMGDDTTVTFQDIILRFQVGGSADVVYSEGDHPLVKIHISSLVTSP